MENRLGLRPGAEEQADAVVRGVITGYEADRQLSFSQTQGGGIAVTRRLVQIVVSVEIYDLREEVMLWQRQGLRVEGEYRTAKRRSRARGSARAVGV